MSDYPIVNNEITSKLASEIRKKLDEIGRSSDDELPEYIMVMIANQRTKFQMKDDLSLFLGRDCISFVDWLLDRMEVLKSEQDNKDNKDTTNKDTNKDKNKASTSSKSQGDQGVELILDEEMDLDLVGGDDKLNAPTQSDEDEEGAIEDDSNRGENADGEGGKVQERCKYWPSCTTGDECPYHHPTTPCRAFPNCRFGDKCLYIHPTCKFDTSCTRRGCPFAHSGGARRMAPKAPYWAAPAPTAIAKCKYGLSCLNPKCPFIHPRPEPCRFGSNCLLDTCPYTHPNDELKKPPHSAFKWTAQS